MNVCDITHIQTWIENKVRIYWLNSSDVRGNLTEKKKLIMTCDLM